MGALRRSAGRATIVSMAGFLLLAARNVEAATKTWNGTSSANWSDGANWTPSGAPVAGDDLVFPDGAGNLANTNDLAAGTSFNSIAFGTNNYQLSGNSITLGPGGINSHSNVLDALSNNILFGVALGSDCVFTVSQSTLAIIGVISGAHNLTMTGAGTVILTGPNTYSGTTLVSSGLLLLNDLALGAADGTLATGTTVTNGGFISIFAPLAIGNEALTLNGNTIVSFDSASWAGPITLNATSMILANAALTLSGPIGGAGGLTKEALGLLRLTAANAYTGSTTINQGTLSIENSQPSDVTVNSGGTLTGSNAGNMGAVTVNGGTIDPGVSPGGAAIITVNGPLSLNSVSSFVVDLNDLFSFDRVAVNGTVNLGSSTLVLHNNFGSATGDSFNIIPNDGTDAVVGTFNGLPEGATFSVGGSLFQISYVAGSGNDVTLTRVGGATTPTTTPTQTLTPTPAPTSAATPTSTPTSVGPAPVVPTLSLSMMLLFVLALGASAVFLIRRGP
jgi:autotransporter-associated beta strand protein